MLSAIVDITERKRAEEAIRESEERFRFLVEGIKDYGIFMLDPSGQVASWNAGAEQMKLYKADEIIGHHFFCFYQDEDVADGRPQRELDIATRATTDDDEHYVYAIAL